MSISTRVRKVAVNDKEFMEDFYAAGNEKVPTILWGQIEETIFAAGYCGWLVGKKGPIEGGKIYSEIRTLN